MNELAVAAAIACCAAAGLYLALSRDLMNVVVGLLAIGAAANLFVFAAGRLGPALAPLVPEGRVAVPGAVANPLPQALVLTAIVIGFALACFAMALVLGLRQRARTTDVRQLRATEPEPNSGGDPGELP
jgi:multisubunit Na+/H+ antiporter MnhC subunit